MCVLANKQTIKQRKSTLQTKFDKPVRNAVWKSPNATSFTHRSDKGWSLNGTKWLHSSIILPSLLFKPILLNLCGKNTQDYG